jgi:hypothetical protein
MALNSKYGRKRKLHTKPYANKKKKGQPPKSIFKTNAISHCIFISQPLDKLNCMVVVGIIRKCHKQDKVKDLIVAMLNVRTLLVPGKLQETSLYSLNID